MQLTILGCSGGISPGEGTTAFLLDKDTLIDAGTGVENLTHEQMSGIKQIVLTHSHLDHVCHLPFLLNNLIGEVEHAVQVFGLPETVNALKEHIFNNVIWPDFTSLPSPENPILSLQTFQVGDKLMFSDKEISVLPAVHSVPAVGFRVSKNGVSFAFSGDCATNDALWSALNESEPVDFLIVDDQYLETEKAISEMAKHYYPAALKKDLEKLDYRPKLYLTHLPPYKKEIVIQEAQAVLSDWHPKVLQTGQVMDLSLK